MNSIIICLSFTIFFAPKYLCSQEISNSVTCTGGETFVAQDYSLDFAIGEPIVESYLLENKLLTQGFLQEKLGPTAVNELRSDAINVKLYPNPAREYLTIDCQNNNSPFWYEIVNTTGSSSGKKACKNFPEILDVSNLKPGIYLLRLSNSANDQFSSIFIKK